MAHFPQEDETALRDFEKRFQRIAFRTGISGLCVVIAVFAMTLVTGEATSASVLEASTYALILSGMSLASYRDFHVKRAFFSGLLLLFAAYWLFSFYKFSTGDIQSNSLVFILFIPAFIAIGLNSRMLFGLSIVQFSLVWFSFSKYAPVFYADTLSPGEQTTLGLTIAAVSGTLFILLGLVQMDRKRTDINLARVIADKDRLASTDPLTGLLNRRAFLEALKHTSQESGPLTLAFIDLNNFKPLNDQYGHAAGDAVLKAVGIRLELSKSVIIAARPGGDEFAVALDPALSETQTGLAIAELYGILAHDVLWDHRLITVGVSLGYSQLQDKDEGPATCLSEADAAMRRCKGIGGGYARFSPEVDGAAIQSDLLQITFPKALASGLIRPALQPIADAKSFEIVGYELLARWTGDTATRQPGPDDFIPVAEKLGLLNDLLSSTLKEALANRDASLTSLAVNVSPGQLQKSGFIDNLLRILASHEVAPDMLTLEITEQVALRNLDANLVVLERARRAGMSIALDDFGTGYSSLSMLGRLPLDKLKIDQSLVHAQGRNAKDTPILKGAIRLARELELTCCVEGVSSEEIARQMQRYGADQLQGFWIGRPKLVTAPSEVVRLAS